MHCEDINPAVGPMHHPSQAERDALFIFSRVGDGSAAPQEVGQIHLGPSYDPVMESVWGGAEAVICAMAWAVEAPDRGPCRQLFAPAYTWIAEAVRKNKP
jgi:hypothetical protein